MSSGEYLITKWHITSYSAIYRGLHSVLMMGTVCTLFPLMVSDDVLIYIFFPLPYYFYFSSLFCEGSIPVVQVKLFFGLKCIVRVMGEFLEKTSTYVRNIFALPIPCFFLTMESKLNRRAHNSHSQTKYPEVSVYLLRKSM